MAKQLSLELTSPNEEGGALSGRVSYNDIHVSQSTFLNGIAADVHRWFRLTPSFGPDLVQEMIERLGVAKDEVILDPFAGAGTTLIEAKLEGHHALGFEINPLLHFVNETSLNWEVSADALRGEVSRILIQSTKHQNIAFQNLATNGLEVPPIHNPTRWWREDVLVRLLVLKREILATADKSARNFLLLTLAGCLVPDLTNVTLGRLQLHFIDRSSDEIDVFKTFELHALKMIADLEIIQARQGCGIGSCILQNATKLGGFAYARKIDAVITSPPYPNRYSYVWNTRPHLYLLGFFATAKEASELDKRTIGGTWGTATSELAKGIVEPLNEAVADVVEPIAKGIRERDNLMANYATHYFNRLATQILEMDRHLSKSARIAYVVGNSWIKDIYIETDVMLGEIFERLGLGYTVTDIHRFRRRHSGERLYETVVYAKKR